MPSLKKPVQKKSLVRRKVKSTQKPAARRAVSGRKPAKHASSMARRKATSTARKVSNAKAKKPVAKKVLKKILKKPLKKLVKAKMPLKVATQKLKAASQKAALVAKSKVAKGKIEAVKAVQSKLAAPKPAPKIVGTMLARPAAPQPVVKTERFSTTATPVKSAGNAKIGYKVNEYVVYPTHGVGQIVSIEEQQIAGLKLELFVVFFAKDRMTLRVPVGKIAAVGMRKISESGLAARALETLKGRPRIKRTMWSRRAQEYEAKINSGDLIAVAEVVRDLYRADTQPEQSYSERQLFEAALDRLVHEIAVVHKADEADARQMIEAALQKSPRRSRAAASSNDENVVPFKKPAGNNDDEAAIEDKAA